METVNNQKQALKKLCAPHSMMNQQKCVSVCAHACEMKHIMYNKKDMIDRTRKMCFLNRKTDQKRMNQKVSNFDPSS